MPNSTIFLFGPTAVGKTDLLMDLFEGRAEIISADSMQVYKGMDIGSAKPDKEYLARLPHHIIDFLPYNSTFNAGDFVKMAEEAIKDISSRGKIPVVSGGTAFYFLNLSRGLPKIKVDTTEQRKILNERLATEGLESLRKELERIDPKYASTITKNDTNRTIRALEVFMALGKPLSSFDRPTELRNDLKMLFLGLKRERSELYSRIDKRVEIMFEMGLLDEIRKLMCSGAKESDSGMRGIGYSEFFQVKGRGCNSLHSIKELIKKNSRRYAKRQITFFSSLEGVKWFHPDLKKEISIEIDSFLQN